jgi:hypothetical protein
MSGNALDKLEMRLGNVDAILAKELPDGDDSFLVQAQMYQLDSLLQQFSYMRENADSIREEMKSHLAQIVSLRRENAKLRRFRNLLLTIVGVAVAAVFVSPAPIALDREMAVMIVLVAGFIYFFFIHLNQQGG